MKNLILLSFTVLLSTFAWSQYAGGGTPAATPTGNQANAKAKQAISQFLGTIKDSEAKRQKKEITNAQGSPYTYNTFKPATLHYDGEKIGTIFYRYNALNEEIEIKKTPLLEEEHQALMNDKNIHITVDGKKMSFKTFITAKKRTTNGYLTQLIDGTTYDLYKRITVKFTEGSPAQNSFVSAVPARFSKFTEYYFQKKGVNRIDEIIAKNSKFLKLLDTGAKEKMKIYLKEHKLNVKNERDLIKAIKYLNTL